MARIQILTLNNKIKRFKIVNSITDVNEESPPEPAPPEVPPRGPSLHATSLRRRNEYALPSEDNNTNSQESQFMGQGGMLWSFLLTL